MNRFYSRIISSLCVIFLSVSPVISSADSFEDDFDDNDISDWDAGWAAPADSDIWLINPGFYHPAVKEGRVSGRSGIPPSLPNKCTNPSETN